MKNDDMFVLLVQSSVSFEGAGKKLEDYGRYLCMSEVIAGDGLYNRSFFYSLQAEFLVVCCLEPTSGASFLTHTAIYRKWIVLCLSLIKAHSLVAAPRPFLSGRTLSGKMAVRILFYCLCCFKLPCHTCPLFALSLYLSMNVRMQVGHINEKRLFITSNGSDHLRKFN